MADLQMTSTPTLESTSGEPEKKKRKKPDLPIVPIKNTADYQRMKLERLMANPDKPVNIPQKLTKDKDLPPPPEFVRNVMGSSAGAGSGEFHVYRHLRRKEYARQKAIVETSKKDQEEEEYRRRIEENKRMAEEKTAKKRAKRQRKKEKLKNKKMKKGNNGQVHKDSGGDSSSDDSNNSDSEDSDMKTSKKNGQHNASNKPKPVVPTYAVFMSQTQPPPNVVDDSSDSD